MPSPLDSSSQSSPAKAPFPAASAGREGDPAPTLQNQLNWVLIAWAFGAFWLWTISGAVMTQFAKALGMPDYGFGLLAALPFAGTLMQIPASYLQQRYGWRKGLFIAFASFGRAMWLAVAALPWVLEDPRDGWPIMVVLLLVSWLAMQATAPAWMSWMSDLIPRRVRGRFFGRRQFIAQPVGLIAVVAAGWALDLAFAREAQDPAIVLKVTSAVLAFAGVMGVLDILCFLPVRDPAPSRPQRDESLWSVMRAPLRDRDFRRYLRFNFTFMLAMGFIGQYVWLYILDEVGWSNTWANALVIGVPLILNMIGYPLWGRAIDRLGKKPVLILTGWCVTFGALGWLFVTPTYWVGGYLLVLAVVFTWPGMELANLNFILNMAGSRPEARRGAGAAYVAINSLAVALGGVLSGVFAAWIAGALADLRYDVPLLDITLTYHSVLFLASTALRGLAMLFAVNLAEPKAAGTREAIQYMGVGLYSNVRQALLMPTRAVGRVLRWSYRINGGPRRA